MTQHAHVAATVEPIIHIQQDWEGWRAAMLQSDAFKAFSAKMHEQFMAHFNTAIDFAKAGHFDPIRVIYDDLIRGFEEQDDKNLLQLAERFCLPVEVTELHQENGASIYSYG